MDATAKTPESSRADTKPKGRGSLSAQSVSLQKSIQSELKHLRMMLKTVTQKFLLRVEGRIESLARELSEPNLSDTFAGLTPEQAGKSLNAIRNLIKTLRVRPDRGRRKDLKRIENLLESISWILDYSTPRIPFRELPRSKKLTKDEKKEDSV